MKTTNQICDDLSKIYDMPMMFGYNNATSVLYFNCKDKSKVSNDVLWIEKAGWILICDKKLEEYCSTLFNVQFPKTTFTQNRAQLSLEQKLEITMMYFS